MGKRPFRTAQPNTLQKLIFLIFKDKDESLSSATSKHLFTLYIPVKATMHSSLEPVIFRFLVYVFRYDL